MNQPIMCAAIPAAARRGWRTDVGCASSASVEIEWNGETWHICKIHEAVWLRAVATHTEDVTAGDLGNRMIDDDGYCMECGEHRDACTCTDEDYEGPHATDSPSENEGVEWCHDCDHEQDDCTCPDDDDGGVGHEPGDDYRTTRMANDA